MGMRLDSALKLYVGLYVVCFLLTWLVSVPMLIMVTPQSECLLFVTPYVRYGSAASKFGDKDPFSHSSARGTRRKSTSSPPKLTRQPRA